MFDTIANEGKKESDLPAPDAHIAIVWRSR